MAPFEIGFKTGYISLDEPKSVYYSGQIILGTINFTLNENSNVLALNVLHLGEANVYWTEKQTENNMTIRRKNKIEYVGYEEYFKSFHSIIRSPTILPSGTHSIPFSYQIPYTAPSSFDHEKGNVKYSVTASITTENGEKVEITKEYKVIAPLHLSATNINTPVVLNIEEIQCSSWFCKSRPVSIRIHTPQAAYSPGEDIPIRLDMINEANIEIAKIVFMLTVKERYHSQKPEATFTPAEEILVSKKLGPLSSRTNQVVASTIRVPDMIAPNLSNCNIIDVDYFIKVKVKLSGSIKAVERESGIFIGLVSINNEIDRNIHLLYDSLPNSPLPDGTNEVTPLEGQNVGSKFIHEYIANYMASSAASKPSTTFLSIAEVVEKNRPEFITDLYTSYEIGFKTKNVPLSMLPSS